MKSKGKAAVDVIGGRFGKAGGGVIQSTVFLLLPSYTFNEATPFFALVFFFVMIAWTYAVIALGVEYNAAINKGELKEVMVDKNNKTTTPGPNNANTVTNGTTVKK
jgi:AAA family ATP:ADP antiporter